MFHVWRDKKKHFNEPPECQLLSRGVSYQQENLI